MNNSSRFTMTMACLLMMSASASAQISVGLSLNGSQTAALRECPGDHPTIGAYGDGATEKMAAKACADSISAQLEDWWNACDKAGCSPSIAYQYAPATKNTDGTYNVGCYTDHSPECRQP